jgi:hypothetical protein
VFEKLLSRERYTPLMLAGRVVLPAAPALTDEQKKTALHAFKIRCVSALKARAYDASLTHQGPKGA